jgi:hypothetical protein
MPSLPAPVKKVVSNPTVQKSACALLLAILAALGLSLNSGCHSLTPAQEARLDKLDCQARALEPLVSPALDAAELVRDLYAGKADLADVLANVGASREDVKALLDRLRACEGPPPEVPDAGLTEG